MVSSRKKKKKKKKTKTKPNKEIRVPEATEFTLRTHSRRQLEIYKSGGYTYFFFFFNRNSNSKNN